MVTCGLRQLTAQQLVVQALVLLLGRAAASLLRARLGSAAECDSGRRGQSSRASPVEWYRQGSLREYLSLLAFCALTSIAVTDERSALDTLLRESRASETQQSAIRCDRFHRALSLRCGLRVSCSHHRVGRHQLVRAWEHGGNTPMNRFDPARHPMWTCPGNESLDKYSLGN